MTAKHLMSATPCVAACRTIHLAKWLGGVFDVRPEVFLGTLLTRVTNRVDEVLHERQGNATDVPRWEKYDEGLIFICSSPEALLEAVRALRCERKLSELRFAQWAFVMGSSEIERRRCIDLARYANPPNEPAVSDSSFAQILGRELRPTGGTGRPSPPGCTWFVLDEETEGSREVQEDLRGILLEPARAYAEVWGMKSWDGDIQRDLSSLRLKPGALTTLGNALRKAVTEKARVIGLGDIVVRTGPGADSFDISASSADKLLRLVIWVQSDLARNGGAFLAWALGMGIPERVGEEPSDAEFLNLHQILQQTKNGDVLATGKFIGKLIRPELRALASPQGVIGNVAEIKWWESPYRALTSSER